MSISDQHTTPEWVQQQVRKRAIYPHDRFAKQSLKEKRIYLALIKAYVAPQVYARLKLNTLEVIDPHVERSGLSTLACDILYKCKLKHPEGDQICLLVFEHQSTAKVDMASRFLHYTNFLLQHYRDRKTHKLPHIYSFCIYHGTSSPYPYSTHICDEFGDPDLAKKVLSYHFHLRDLTQMSIESLLKHGEGAFMEILLKLSREKEALPILLQLERKGLFKKIRQHTRPEYLLNAFYYAVEFEKDEQSALELINIFIRTLPKERETFMTFRESMIREGKEEGIQEGIQQAKREDAERMLAEGIDPALVKKITGWSKEDGFEPVLKERPTLR